MRRMQVGAADTAGLAAPPPPASAFQRWWLKWRVFILAIAVPRMLSPNFGAQLSVVLSLSPLRVSL
eukprot:SAG22_NODE_242_length_14104_cov_13.581935_14_plen_66_part_00